MRGVLEFWNEGTQLGKHSCACVNKQVSTCKASKWDDITSPAASASLQCASVAWLVSAIKLPARLPTHHVRTSTIQCKPLYSMDAVSTLHGVPNLLLVSSRKVQAVTGQSLAAIWQCAELWGAGCLCHAWRGGGQGRREGKEERVF